MRRFVLASLLLGLWACGSSSSFSHPYAEPNDLMGEAIDRRIATIPFQHREELFNNLIWLSQLGEQAIPALLQGLGHEDPKVRSNCAWVLGRVGDRRTISDLSRLADDENEQGRLEVARTLVNMGDMSQVPTLIGGLDSDKVQVRYLCHEALKGSTARDFGYDHLSASKANRRRTVFQWRSWWSEQSGDAWFAKEYAQEYGLDEQGEPVAEPPAAPDGETETQGKASDKSPAEGEKTGKS